MISLNRVIVAGTLTKTPTLQETASGRKFTTFLIAAKDAWHTKDNEIAIRSTLIPITCVGKLAENVCKYLDKDKSVMVEGRLESDIFGKDDKKQVFLKVNASSVVFLEKTGSNSEA